MNDIDIIPITVPTSLDAQDAWSFGELVRLNNETAAQEVGSDYLREEPLEMWEMWRDQSEAQRHGFLAVRHGRGIGAATMALPQDSGARTTDFALSLEADAWDTGIGGVLLRRLEDIARSRGRKIMQTWTLHGVGATQNPLAPTTGWGSIPADDANARFFLAEGFTLGQVERSSTFDLRGDMTRVRTMLAEATAAASEDYRLLTWTAPTPVHHRAGYAYVMSRMATDAPSGDLVFDEEDWDADRVARRDARQTAQGMTVSVAAILHVPTDTICAYNELVLASPAGVTHQWGTLVLKEHRGHRLGTIVKCANILRWRDIAPDSPMICTFNAEENRPMLDINEALDFAPKSRAGAWRKNLD